MICLSLRLFLTPFLLAFLRTLVRIHLVLLSGAAFRYPGFPFLIRLNLLFFTSTGWTVFWCNRLLFVRLNPLLLASVCGTDYRCGGSGLHALFRLNPLLFTSAGRAAFRHYGFSFLFGLNLALLRLEPLPLFYSSPPAFWSGRFPYLFRLNLLNHGLSLTGSSRRSNSIDREGLWL